MIAEIKKASPSRGLVCAGFRPVAIVTIYESVGAACLSVLTDEPYFQGSPKYLKQVRAAAGLPVLHRGSIINEYQTCQAYTQGVDAILLIVTALGAERLERFEQAAHSLSMTVLPELHERGEFGKYRNLTTLLQDVNNRNLHIFGASLQQTLDLLPSLAGKTVVTESDIRNKDGVNHMYAYDVHTFLIGGTFVHTNDIEVGARKLF